MQNFTKVYIAFLSLFLTVNIIAEDLTPPQLDSNSTYVNSIEDNLGNFYTVYQDGSDANKRGTLLKYNGTSWNIIPSFESSGGTDFLNEAGYEFQQNALKVDTANKLHILYIDYDPNFDEYVLSYLRYNQDSHAFNGWESQGINTFFSDGLDGFGSYTPLASDIALDLNSSDTPIVAYISGNDNSINIKYLNANGTQGTDNNYTGFDDDTWDTLGGSDINKTSSEVSLAIDNDVPYLAYQENLGGKVSVMKYEADIWSDFDSNISTGIATNINLYVADDENLYLSYVDSNTTPVVAKLRRYVSINFEEESTDTITEITSTDTANITYTLGGYDKALFSITNDGNLSFTNAPSYETNEDNNTDGIYEVSVILANSTTDLSVEKHFNVVLTDIDDIPTLSTIANEVKIEDFSDFNVSLDGVDEDGNTIVYTVSSSDSTVATVSIVDGKVVVTPIADANGVITVEVNATANGEVATQSFDINITAVDDAPIFTIEQGSYGVQEDETSYSVLLGASDTESDAFTYNSSASNNKVTISLVDNNLTITPNTNVFGDVNIDVNVTQDTNSSLYDNYSFTVSINAVNDAPTIDTSFSDITLVEDNGTTNYELNVSDIEGSDLNVSVESNNTSILNVTSNWTNVVNQGTWSQGLDFNLSTVTEANGLVRITITTIDDEDENSTTSFDVNVSAINDSPILTGIANQTKTEDFDDFNLTLSSTDIDSSSLTYSAISNDTDKATVSINGDKLTISSVANANGIVSIDVNVSDGSLSDSKSFDLNITAVDDAPILALLEDITNSEDNASISINLTELITDIDNNISEVIFDVTTTNSALVDVQIVNGQLILIPKTNANGKVTIELSITINGKTATQSFIYTISEVNDAPIIENIEDIRLDRTDLGMDEISDTITFTLYDDQKIISLEVNSSNTEKITVSVVDNNNGTGTLSYTVSANETGTVTVTISSEDGEYTSTESFNIVVNTSDDKLCVDDTLRALTFDDIKNTNIAQNYITSDLNFITSMDTVCSGTTIDWNVSDTFVISNTGEVNATVNNKTVAVVATISKGVFYITKQFLLTVAKTTIKATDARDNITFEMIRLDNSRKSEIVSNLNLILLSLDKDVKWTSSDDTLVDPYTGVVIRPSTDTNVTLIATIDNNVSVTKIFNLRVLSLPTDDLLIVSQDAEWLTYSKILGENRSNDSILYNLTKPLPSTGPNGGTIEWSTTNTNVITTDGDVFRDDADDKYVQLVATISSAGEVFRKEFTLKVEKLVTQSANSTIFQRVDEDNNSISIIYTDNNSSDLNTTANFSSTLYSLVERVISDNSVQSIVELLNSVVDIFLNTDGTAESQSESIDENNNSVITGIRMNIPQSNTDIDENGTVNTSVRYDVNTTIQANMDANGTVSHVITIDEYEPTRATSTIQGSRVVVDVNGSIETVSEVTVGGSVIRAIATTLSDGTTTTKFVSIDLATGNESNIENTLSDSSSFELGSIVSISYINGVIYIETNAPLNSDLHIQ